ncbi:bifunctional pyr operon transcriptional regulator/uracil phosphoribosyltransferase PyrR [uncultured Limosilactobacillus sp.]|uniref:bifunctional pyr operon transcriptional regulator/uracil phosphoribosyltransferase PyrR n=1 Tax=uncultured Limosilactobacillus sp. TaxID=2837629 RepID=UPI0025D7914F|nr:bifunctional pyr operon transcriptional regulator/uracil phosphoribosyltransferase PyrR [uncultured Limosilactobacillus sp.]
MEKTIADNLMIQRSLTRLTYEIIEKNKGINNLILVGVKTRGEFLAKRIAEQMAKLEGNTVPVCAVDVSAYRDDRHDDDKRNQFADQITTQIDDQHIVLVDDVFYTGRTMRAAMDALMDMGRPKRISIAVLVDRGHREMPIRPDFVGKNIPTANDEKVQVNLSEVDQQDQINLIK